MVVGPSLAAGDVAPDLFCDEQIDGTVLTVTGKGFAPLPTKTLEGTTQLVLPKVEILGASSFAGLDPATPSLVIADDAANPTASALTFVSEAELRVALGKGQLSAGVYDLRVTNPDGVTTATWPTALAVVPPPELVGFDSEVNALACLAEGEAVRTVTGKWFARVDGTPPTLTVGSKAFEVTEMGGCEKVEASIANGIELCTSITFKLPQNALPPGIYELGLKNPEPVGCSSSKTLSVGIVAPPTILDVIPNAFCDDGQDKTFTIEGEGFVSISGSYPSVTVGGMPVSLDGTPMDCMPFGDAFVGVDVCNQLVVTLPKTYAVGEHEVAVTNPKPVDCSATSPVKVSVAPIPTVDATSVLPKKLCSGGGTVTFTGTGFWVDSKMNQPVVTFVPKDGGAVIPANVATCEDCDPVLGMPGTKITATVGAGLTPGVVYEVTVTNPGDCPAVGPFPTIDVQTGPILFLADPSTVPNQINARVTLYATKLVQPLPMTAAWIVPTGQMMPIIDLTDATVDPLFPKRVQVTVPKGTPAGLYDVYLKDDTGCPAAMLKEGLQIADKEDLTIQALTPAFGDDAVNTAISIFRDTVASKAKFITTPRIYLNPAKSTSPPPDAKAIQLTSTSFVSGDKLTAVVPAGTPVGTYDVLVVNPEPTAEVGILYDGFRVVKDAPPIVSDVVPPSIVAQAGQDVEVIGTDFRAGVTVSASCVNTQKMPVPAPTVTVKTPPSGSCLMDGKNCKLVATIDGSALAQGYVCLLKVRNTDATFGEYSAIGVTNASLNLEVPKAGSKMTTPRRALGSAAAKPTTAARFLYAIAGDDGTAAGTKNDVEFVDVDLYGVMGPTWRKQQHSLLQKRAFFGTAQTPRYVYVVGGTSNSGDPNAALSSAERAQVLDPLEAPVITDVDFSYDQLGGTGLLSGQWIYRVSAEFAALDPHNPAGEGLPSDPLILKLPAGTKLGIKIFWKAPVDCAGNPLPNVVKYHVYRSPVAGADSGKEEHIAEVPGNVTEYDDKGQMPDPTHLPLVLGSTGKWTPLPGLGAGNEREGVAALIGVDPTTPATKRYLYALFGRSKTASLNNYQYLPIEIDACGHETIGAASWTTGASTATTSRRRHMAWLVDRSVRTDVGATTNVVYVGGGIGPGGGQDTSVLRAKVGTNGDLGTFTVLAQSLKSGGVTGGGVLAAAQQLFSFGGFYGNIGTPDNKGLSGQVINGNGDLASNTWNAGLSLLVARGYMGSSVQSAFAFFIGGQTDAAAATDSTELVVW